MLQAGSRMVWGCVLEVIGAYSTEEVVRGLSGKVEGVETLGM